MVLDEAEAETPVLPLLEFGFAAQPEEPSLEAGSGRVERRGLRRGPPGVAIGY